MSTQLISQIESSQSVLVLLPSNPHFDQVAAALSLYLVLEKKGKNINISCPSPMLVEFNRLVGVDRVTPNLGNKNLIIKFNDYNAENVDKVSYDIVEGQFKLTVTPKSGVESPALDKVGLSYEGIGADLCILIGGGHDGHFPDLAKSEFENISLSHLGIRPLNTSKKVYSFASSASSVCELVFNLLREGGLDFDQDIATNLLMGIEEGSRSFTTQEVTANTFEAVAHLMKMGGKRFTKADSPDRKSFPPGSIPKEPFNQSNNNQAQNTKVPKTWLEPKIYKGTTVS